MHRELLLLISSVSLVVAGAMLTPQQDKPAEEVFKNIKSFKGKPSSDVIPAMNFMAASLKVDCAFCHNPKDFSSDEKDEKVTARRMITMQGELNKQFFEGHTAVTCNSCHNGSSRPNRTPKVGDLTPRHTRFKNTLKPTDLFDKYWKAVGGDFKSLTLKGTRTDHGQTMPLEMVQEGPDKFLANMGDNKVGSDGSTYWFKFGDRISPVVGDNALRMKRMGRWFRGPKAFDGYERLMIAGKDKVSGKPAIVVRGSVPADHLTEEFYFDEESGLLVRVATMTETALGILPTYTDYSNYKKVGGVLVPFKVASVSGGEESEMVYKSGKANQPVDDKIFGVPASK